jgi:hypothetical protein
MKYIVGSGIRPQLQEIVTGSGVRMGFGHPFTLRREAYAKMTNCRIFPSSIAMSVMSTSWSAGRQSA